MREPLHIVSRRVYAFVLGIASLAAGVGFMFWQGRPVAAQQRPLAESIEAAIR